jgi:hypothetical protein
MVDCIACLSQVHAQRLTSTISFHLTMSHELLQNPPHRRGNQGWAVKSRLVS